MKLKHTPLLALALASLTPTARAQDVLPFPEPESASTTGKTLADSKHQWRKAENRLNTGFATLKRVI